MYDDNYGGTAVWFLPISGIKKTIGKFFSFLNFWFQEMSLKRDI